MKVTFSSVFSASLTLVMALMNISCEKSSPVTAVLVSQTELTMAVGESRLLSYSIAPAGVIPFEDAVWSSSDESVATVQDGRVNALAKGNAEITVVVDGKKDVCSLTVLPKSPLSVSLDKSEVSLYVGEETTLVATVNPSDSEYELEWSVEDSNIASVDKSGKVTAIAEGLTKLVVKAGEAYAECFVFVSPVGVTGISLDKSSLTMRVGGTETINATVTPDNAGDKTVKWSTSNENVATVSPEGVVSAVGIGSAVIKAAAGQFTAECTVVVEAIPVEGVEISKTEMTLELGKSERLTAVVKPVNASDKTLVWMSSDETVVTVNQSGLVTAVAAGEAVVTVKAGEFSASCRVSVPKPQSNYKVGDIYYENNVAMGIVIETDITNANYTDISKPCTIILYNKVVGGKTYDEACQYVASLGEGWIMPNQILATNLLRVAAGYNSDGDYLKYAKELEGFPEGGIKSPDFVWCPSEFASIGFYMIATNGDYWAQTGDRGYVMAVKIIENE